METPNTQPTAERPELPEYIQEQIRKRQQMTREEVEEIIERQSLRNPGAKVAFAVSEREYIMKSLLRDALKKKAMDEVHGVTPLKTARTAIQQMSPTELAELWQWFTDYDKK